ncbi:MAG: GC-type dockerin domain-anchored protein [Planctomycetota bacterium]
MTPHATALAVLTAVATNAGAQPTLLGDEISVRIAVPNISGFDQTQTTIVTDDDSDMLEFRLGTFFQILVDPGPQSFVLTATGTQNTNIAGGSVFEFGGLDYSQAAEVTGASFAHNWVNINADTSFTSDSASVNFNGNSSFGLDRMMTVTPIASSPPIETVGVMTEQTNQFGPKLGEDLFISEAAVSASMPLGSFTHSFSSLGEIGWNVTWTAPEGRFIEVRVPAGFDSVGVRADFNAGSGQFAGPNFRSEPTPVIVPYLDSPILPFSTTDATISGPGNDSVSALALIPPFDQSLQPGEVYRFTSITLPTTIPASFDNDLDSAIGEFSLTGFAGADIAGPMPADPGQWVRIVSECPADTNGDGLVTPADFNAWVLAFNQRLPECDQNGDRVCTPADFNAWILNFNTGCP